MCTDSFGFYYLIFRFPYATFEIQYRYRFQAPDHSMYGISWISFITEKLENFNWNYMDHYLCVRGDMDYALHEVRFVYTEREMKTVLKYYST